MIINKQIFIEKWKYIIRNTESRNKYIYGSCLNNILIIFRRINSKLFIFGSPKYVKEFVRFGIYWDIIKK